MANLGETVYLRHVVNGITGYMTLPYGGNIPYGETQINKDEYIKGLQETQQKAKDFINYYDASTPYAIKPKDPAQWNGQYYTGPVYNQEGVDNIQKLIDEANSGTGVHAPGYVDPSFSKFQANAPTPSEQYYTPQTFAALNPREQARLKQLYPTSYSGTATAVKAPDDPSNEFNTATGARNPNYKAPGSSSAPAPTSTTLQQGTGSSSAPNESVRSIQRQLGITADGIFGPQTKSAVMAFQQTMGLTPDGIIGPQTQAALQKAFSTGGANGTGGGASTTNTSTTNNTTASTPAFDINQPTYVVKAGDKFNPYNGQPLTNVAPGTVINNPKTQVDHINNNANTEQDNLLKSLLANVGSGVDVSESSKLLKSISEALTATPPVPKSDVQTYNDERAALNVGPLEDSRNSIQAEIDKLDADYKTLTDTETNRPVSVLQINRRKTQEQIQYEDARRQLAVKLDTVNNQLNQKYSIIDTMVKYTDADNQTAQQNYTNQFNKAIALTNLIKGITDDQKSDAEKAVDNARANATLMINTLKDKNVNYNSLDASSLNDIKNLEIQAGLPTGFIKFALSATDQPVVSFGSEFTDANGKRQVPIYTKNPSTGAITTQVIEIGTGGSSNDNVQNYSNLLKTGKDGSGTVFGNPMGSDGYSDPSVYITAFTHWPGTTAEFLSKFPVAKYINPASYKLLPASIQPKSNRELPTG